MDANQLWTHLVKAMELAPHNKRNWFDPVRISSFDGKVLTVNAGSGFGAYWLKTHYAQGMDEILNGMIPGARVAITHKPFSLRG